MASSRFPTTYNPGGTYRPSTDTVIRATLSAGRSNHAHPGVPSIRYEDIPPDNTSATGISNNPFTTPQYEYGHFRSRARNISTIEDTDNTGTQYCNLRRTGNVPNRRRSRLVRRVTPTPAKGNNYNAGGSGLDIYCRGSVVSTCWKRLRSSSHAPFEEEVHRAREAPPPFCPCKYCRKSRNYSDSVDSIREEKKTAIEGFESKSKARMGKKLGNWCKKTAQRLRRTVFDR